MRPNNVEQARDHSRRSFDEVFANNRPPARPIPLMTATKCQVEFEALTKRVGLI